MQTKVQDGDLEVMTRREAFGRGLKYYFTGQPCKYDHVGPRFTSSGACTLCFRRGRNSKNSPRANHAYDHKNIWTITDRAGYTGPIPWTEIFEILHSWTDSAYLAALKKLGHK